MIVELGLAAIVPGILVGLHYGVQISRPLWGHGSDTGGSRTLWIIGGMALLAISGVAAAASTLAFEVGTAFGMLAALIAFAFIGFGVGVCGTSLLALLANRTAPARRPAAASMVWIMMIAGIIITAATTAQFLEPYSHMRLVAITAVACSIAFVLTCVAIMGVERKSKPATRAIEQQNKPSFQESLSEVWEDREARLFTIFVFISMLAYFTQDLILEPFGGLLFGLSVAETTKLTQYQHQGVLMGMLLVGGLGSFLASRKLRVLRAFTIIGCIGSGMALAGLAIGALFAPNWPLQANISALGFANGAFAVAAIGTMMSLAGSGRKAKEGVRMGVWGAAQALAAGIGIFFGTVLFDLTRLITSDDPTSFAVVFGFEALLFIGSAWLAGYMSKRTGRRPAPSYASQLEPAE
jgi:BCD family chlorophyll transporter-like MFS transporter